MRHRVQAGSRPTPGGAIGSSAALAERAATMAATPSAQAPNRMRPRWAAVVVEGEAGWRWHRTAAIRRAAKEARCVGIEPLVRSRMAAPARLAAWCIGRRRVTGDRDSESIGGSSGAGHPTAARPPSSQCRQERPNSLIWLCARGRLDLQPVVIGDPLAPRGRAGSELADADGHGQVGDRGVGRLAGPVGDQRAPAHLPRRGQRLEGSR
jgi:hypothetical protein